MIAMTSMLLNRRCLRIVAAFVMAAVMLAVSVSAALACDITVNPSSPTAVVGEQQTVTVSVKLTHNNCLVPIDQTTIKPVGMSIVAQTGWQQISGGYQKQLTVVFTQPGQARLTVVRECSKGGDTASVTINVSPAPAAPAPPSTLNAEPPKPVEPQGSAGAPNPSADPGLGAAPSNGVQPAPAPQLSPAPQNSQSEVLQRGRGRRTSAAPSTGPAAQSPASPASPPPANQSTAATPSTLPPAVAGGAPLLPDQSDGAGAADLEGQPSSRGLDLAVVASRASRDPKTLGVLFLLAVAGIGYLRGYRWLRPAVLLVSLGYLGFYLGGCICPLGAIQKLALPEVTLSQSAIFMVVLGIPLLATLLFGRIYCGWVCPAGALQEIVHYGRLAVKVPPRVDRYLKYLKYVAFVALIAAVRMAGEPVFEGIDPFRVAFDRGGELLPTVALAAILLLSVFVYRPWCRYLCPIAVPFALASRVSFLRLAPAASCVGCKLCVKACPSQSLSVAGEPRRLEVDASECLACGECRPACRKGALKVSLPSLFRRRDAGAGTAPASPAPRPISSQAPSRQDSSDRKARRIPA